MAKAGTKIRTIVKKVRSRGKKTTIPVVEAIGLIGEGVSLTFGGWGSHGSVANNVKNGKFDTAGLALLDSIRKPEAHAPLIIVLAGVVGRKVFGKVPITKKISLF